MPSYFADSYALIEILKGNKNYRSFQSERLITTEFNICEVGFAVCRDYPAIAPQVLKTVRKMVTLQATRDEDLLFRCGQEKAGIRKRKEIIDNRLRRIFRCEPVEY